MTFLRPHIRGKKGRVSVTSKQYVEGAVRTESGRFDAQNVPPETVEAVLDLVVAAGQAVDALKRALYYGKPLDQHKLQNAMNDAAASVKAFNNPAAVELKGYGAAPVVPARVVHAALGLVTESAEIVEKVLGAFQTGNEFDYGNFFEEAGDHSWYMAIGIDSARQEDPKAVCACDCGGCDNGNSRDWSFESIWDKNLAKLKARYPDKFLTEKAFSRDIEAEKQALGEN
jgi:hypothetical protein